jgi:hypothetical protein
MSNKKLIISNGDRYGRWIIVEEVETLYKPYGVKMRQFRCICECGNEKVVKLVHLRNQTSKSCGCIKKKIVKVSEKKILKISKIKSDKVSKIKSDKVSEKKNRCYVNHGLSKHILYPIWNAMRQRCLNPKNKSYINYGGRGIKICDRWLQSFNNFLEDMGDRPVGYSIDRINNDGNYEPSNCKWACDIEQRNNQRRNIKSKKQ